MLLQLSLTAGRGFGETIVSEEWRGTLAVMAANSRSLFRLKAAILIWVIRQLTSLRH